MEKQITEDNVSLELAKRLAKVFFDEPCNNAYVRVNKEYKLVQTGGYSNTFWRKTCKDYRYYACPGIHQVLKYFRDIDGIHISPCICTSIRNGEKYSFWSWHIMTIQGESIHDESAMFNPTEHATYEQAAEEGIKYYIEHIIKQLKRKQS
jgi:hypothetical protein